MKRALVTGGAGFLGSHLCERLLKDGYRVVALDSLYTGSRENIAHLAGDANFEFAEGDVIGMDKMDLGDFDEVYNLACPASPVHYQARPMYTTDTCIFGMKNCLAVAERCGAKLLHASTSEIYGDPLVHPQTEKYWGNVNTIGIRSCYDEGKRIAETIASDHARLLGTDVRMVRIFNTYGPRMHPQDGRVVSNFIMQALRGEDITVYGNGSQTRSFQYASDLIEAMRRYMELPKETVAAFVAKHSLGAPVVNTGNPGEYTIRQLAEEVLRQIPESKSKIVEKPLPGDDPKKRKPDIALAGELLGGWKPAVPLREGLAATIEYFRGRK
ncbi:MAG: SDR family oxidoreductase [Kiritimatiellae bacterium]|nr:SDR family oxidoreductase [Kiritimatiellia bacterium]